MIQLHAFRFRVQSFMVGLGFPRDWYISILAAFIGSLAGVAALIYGWLVHYSEYFFYGRVIHQPLFQNHLWLLFLLPAVGGLIVGTVKYTFALPLHSHGIPEIIEALTRNKGRLKPSLGFFTAFNSAISLGSGGSTGQEGPIVQIGSVVGSGVGQFFKMNREHMSTLVGCGAAAGLAAIFNAPIAGVLLVLEVLLRDFSMRTFMPVVIASVFGVSVSQAIAGRSGAIFSMPTDQAMLYHFSMIEAPTFLLLGLGCGLLAWGFSKLLFYVEHVSVRIKFPMPLKPAIGGLVLGVIGFGFVHFFPKMIADYAPPPFFGNGYPVVQYMITPGVYSDAQTNNAFSLLLFFALMTALHKLVGTTLTLGSGGSGGIFAPALFIGACLGGAMGICLKMLHFWGDPNPATYALAGMAGMLSAVVFCPLTAIILIFEITRDYMVILPVMLTAILATLFAQVSMRESLYTMVLRDRGIRVGTHGDLTMLRRIEAGSIPLVEPLYVRPDDPVQLVLDRALNHPHGDFVVCNTLGQYVGLITSEDLYLILRSQDAIPLMIAQELMRSDLPTVRWEETLDLVFDKFSTHEIASLAVIDESGRVMGLITRSRVMKQYHHALSQ